MANNIKVLKPEVFNKISAGEVVETPAGALKELVENSIDAGATRIAIDVKGGGIDLISVYAKKTLVWRFTSTQQVN